MNNNARESLERENKRLLTYLRMRENRIAFLEEELGLREANYNDTIERLCNKIKSIQEDANLRIKSATASKPKVKANKIANNYEKTERYVSKAVGEDLEDLEIGYDNEKGSQFDQVLENTLPKSHRNSTVQREKVFYPREFYKKAPSSHAEKSDCDLESVKSGSNVEDDVASINPLREINRVSLQEKKYSIIRNQPVHSHTVKPKLNASLEYLYDEKADDRRKVDPSLHKFNEAPLLTWGQHLKVEDFNQSGGCITCNILCEAPRDDMEMEKRDFMDEFTCKSCGMMPTTDAKSILPPINCSRTYATSDRKYIPHLRAKKWKY